MIPLVGVSVGGIIVAIIAFIVLLFLLYWVVVWLFIKLGRTKRAERLAAHPDSYEPIPPPTDLRGSQD